MLHAIFSRRVTKPGSVTRPHGRVSLGGHRSRAKASATLLLAAMLFVASAAHASFHTWRIDAVYSNADGTVQFIVLRETLSLNNQRFLAGHRLTVTHAGIARTYDFQLDLPAWQTANRRVLVATQGFADLALVSPDYILPNHFLATDAATLDYAGVDAVTYPSLPTNGTQAIDHGGTAVPAIATNFAGASIALAALPVTSFEYYNAALDHYFITDLQPDIDALDTGRIAGWSRTGQSFRAFAIPGASGSGINPVCRFYIPPAHGNSHFFSASPAECAAVAAKIGTDPNYSGYVFESPNAFYIRLPNTTTGACPAATAPVFRMWNQRADSNHRYTADLAIKAQMITRGYVPEGYGPESTNMCAPTPGRSSLRFLQGSATPNGALLRDAAATATANYQGYQTAGTTIDVGPRAGAGEVIAFSEKRAVTLQAVTWSAATGDQIVDVPLATQLNTPLTIWVVAGPYVTTQQTALTMWSTAQQMYWDERMGTALPVEIVDATANARAAAWNAFDCGTGNAKVAALQSDIGARAGRINVYLVNLVDGSTSRGNACAIGGSFVAIASGATADLLAHELGHDYALEHIDDLANSFDVANLMHSASSSRAYVTEGQSFRAHTHPASAINAVYALRPGLPVRTCDRDTPAVDCPAIAKRLWADAAFGPN